MPEEFITDLNDSRLDPYRDLRYTNRTRDQRWVIAEGRLCLFRLLASQLKVESVVVSQRRYGSLKPQIPSDLELFVIPEGDMEQLLGFQLHSGLIGCGCRPVNLQRPACVKPHRATQLFVACPHTALPENLGTIIRLSAAFGVDGVLVGHRSIDPFLRRVVRVSMGAVFQVPLYLPDDLELELSRLQLEQGFEIVASTLNRDDRPLKDFQPGPRSIVLLGNEAKGLDPSWVELANHKVTIPMADEVDSLNVASAASIILYQLTVGR